MRLGVSNFSTFLKRKKSRKMKQKLRDETTGTKLGRDVDPVSQKSQIKVNRITLLGSHKILLRLWLLFFAKMMESGSELCSSFGFH